MRWCLANVSASTTCMTKRHGYVQHLFELREIVVRFRFAAQLWAKLLFEMMIVADSLQTFGIVKVRAASFSRVVRNTKVVHHVIKFVHPLAKRDGMHIHCADDTAEIPDGVRPKDG